MISSSYRNNYNCNYGNNNGNSNHNYNNNGNSNYSCNNNGNSNYSCNNNGSSNHSCNNNGSSNHSCNNNGNNTSKKELFEIITQSSFALDDIKLFLDTHPFDADALKCYEEYKKIRKVALVEYTREYGPISAYDVNVCNKWTWIESPWPWEGEC